MILGTLSRLAYTSLSIHYDQEVGHAKTRVYKLMEDRTVKLKSPKVLTQDVYDSSVFLKIVDG